MPVSLSELKNRRAEVSVDVGASSPILVVYNPGKWTFQLTDALRDAEEKGVATPWLVGFLKELILGWDLTLEDGGSEPMPVNEKTLQAVPVPVLSMISRKIGEHAVPNAGTTSRSARPS